MPTCARVPHKRCVHYSLTTTNCNMNTVCSVFRTFKDFNFIVVQIVETA